MYYLILLLITSPYLKIINSFFEQDEWHNIGWHIYNIGRFNNSFLELLRYYILGPLPVTQLFNILNFKLFEIKSVIPSILIFIFIILNGILWIKLLRNFTESKIIYFGSLLFGYLTFLGSQGVSWVIPSVSVQLSFFLFLLSINLFIKFIKKSKKFYLIFSLTLFILSFFSKQTVAFLIFLFPVVDISLSNNKLKKIISKYLLISLGLILSILIINSNSVIVSNVGLGRFTGKTQILLNFILIPLKSISQIVIGETQIIRNISKYLLNDYYINSNAASTIYTIGTDFVSVFISFIFILPSIFIIKNIKDRKLIMISITGYILSFIPLFFDKYSTGVGFLESRYYFLPSFFLGIYLSIILDFILMKLSVIKQKWMRNQMKLILYIGLITYFIFQVNLITIDISSKNSYTNKRKEILSQSIEILNIDDYKKFVLYIEDKNYPIKNFENVTGTFFQTGFLYPFLVSNYKEIPYQVFENDDFWSINFNKVKITNEYSIGLFYDFESLSKFVKDNPEFIDNVYHLEFNYENINNQKYSGNFKDIIYAEVSSDTNILRKKLYEQKKQI